MLHLFSDFLFPPLSFHPSFPHIHDPVINLVEISHSLINAPPSNLLVFHSFLHLIVSDSGYFLFPSFIRRLLFCLFGDENEVMHSVRGVREEGCVGLSSIPSGSFSNIDSEHFKIGWSELLNLKFDFIDS